MEGVNFNPFEPETFTNVNSTSSKHNVLAGILIGLSIASLALVFVLYKDQHFNKKIQKQQ